MYNYIINLPDKFNTMVGERGVSLSGGQRQRLSIARSILLRPKIIVFDDSTSAVDAATEQKIRIALKEATKNRTSINSINFYTFYSFYFIEFGDNE